MIGLFDRLRFGFTAKKRAKTLAKKGYVKGTDGNIYRVNDNTIKKVKIKKSWF